MLINKLISLLLLLMLLPAMTIIAIIIFINDGLPIFFKQKRIGLNNKIFLIYKYRTMKNNTPDEASHLIKNKGKYLLSSGTFLRKYSLDELPQLINIIKGDLVFIGPRPALYNQYDLIKLREDKGIHKLTPGITGWAQINGRDNLSNKEKVHLDNYYLKNASFSLRVKIIYKTIFKVIKAENVND
tara:strand:+ start:857 stop:1411 length:555 start_codon:yes stop_codon:yes gene_type:complete